MVEASKQELEVLKKQLYELKLRNFELENDKLRKSTLTCIITSPIRFTFSAKIRSLTLCGPVNKDNWQQSIINSLIDQNLTILNPRRDDWKTANIIESVAWELEHVEKSTAVAFWFHWDHANLATTLLELGRCSAIKRDIFVGIHVNNKQIQTIQEFVRSFFPQIYIANNLEKLIFQITYWSVNGVVKDRFSKTSDSNSLDS